MITFIFLGENPTVCGIFCPFQPCEVFLNLTPGISETFPYAVCVAALTLRQQYIII